MTSKVVCVPAMMNCLPCLPGEPLRAVPSAIDPAHRDQARPLAHAEIERHYSHQPRQQEDRVCAPLHGVCGMEIEMVDHLVLDPGARQLS